MSEVWPFNAKNQLIYEAQNNIREFNCVLLMPFEKRFDQIAHIIKDAVTKLVDDWNQKFGLTKPNVERLDWLNASGAIQKQIWEKIYMADLIFCDITGYNPNVMFEAGICAAWKKMKNVVFLKDHYFKQESIFDIAPIRYTEYSITSEGINKLYRNIIEHTRNALIGHPDIQSDAPKTKLPLRINFKGNHDNRIIYTPSLSHRSTRNEIFEFGSVTSYPNSWASVGKELYDNFKLKFDAKFINPYAKSFRGNYFRKKEEYFIGVGLRSHHYYAGYGHILYLRGDGYIILSTPKTPKENGIGWENITLRKNQKINLNALHKFSIVFVNDSIHIVVDDFARTIKRGYRKKDMKKVLPSGLIRFQAYFCWMGVKRVSISMADVT